MNICAVIVTYNRLEKLKYSLKCYDNLTYKPLTIIIVNNNSNDGTYKFLLEWEKGVSDYKKKVINLSQNIGGSGGFYEGLKESLKYNPEWIWVSDDDAFPDKDSFMNFYKFINKINISSFGKISVVAGMVVNNGKIDINHRRRLKKHYTIINEIKVGEEEYKNKYFEFNLISYVGIFINKEALMDVGLTEREFFIYYDDTEHSIRLNKYGKIICVPDIVINHDINNKEIDTYNWKMYYGYRNKLITIKKHFGKLNFFITVLKYIKLIITTPLKYKIIYYYALIDGVRGRTGVHKIIKPGWKTK